MTKHTTSMVLLNGIDEHQEKLQTIKRRLHLLKAFVTELASVTKDKPFTIWDGLTWMMVLDSRDTLIIHLASFAKGLHKHHLKDLLHPHLHKLKRAIKLDDEYDPLPQEVEEAFDRLFPDCTKKKPGKGDVKMLRCRLEARVEDLRKDRNENRAHAFELVGNARMMHLDEVEEVFDYLEGMLNDLRLVASHGYKATDAEDRCIAPLLTARVLVDRIVLDMPPDSKPERSAMYEELHALHNTNPDRPFNATDDRGLVSPGRNMRPRSAPPPTA